MNKLRVGLVGAGHLGKYHAKFLSEIEQCDFVGIYDKFPEAAQKAAIEFGVRHYESLDELIEASDAVSIVSTTSAHYQLAKAALLKGRHVFIEKPITADIAQAEELVRLADENRLKIQVGHVERFNPALLSLEKYNLDPKFIQSDRLAQFNPRGTDVAVVLDLMIHDIDIILSLIKSEVSEVRASGIAVVSNNIDIANARIEFENGAVANVTASRISLKKMRKMRIFQRDAYLSLDFDTGFSEVIRLLSPDDSDIDKFIKYGEIGIDGMKKAVVYEHPEQVECNALRHEVELFVDAVRRDTKPLVSGLDGLKALKVAEAIIEKINESKIKA